MSAFRETIGQKLDKAGDKLPMVTDGLSAAGLIMGGLNKLLRSRDKETGIKRFAGAAIAVGEIGTATGMLVRAAHELFVKEEEPSLNEIAARIRAQAGIKPMPELTPQDIVEWVG